MRYMLAICVLSLTTLTASAGPLRQWIHDHRPGVLIPKRDVVIETAPQFQQTPMFYYTQPEYVYTVQPTSCPSCANGSCPIKR